MSLVLVFWKWLVFWLGDKWSRFIADSKQKCLNRIVGDTRIGVFWLGHKSLRIYFFSTWKAKNQRILSIHVVSPERAKRRILAALWHSPVLSILQTENLKRKKPVGLTGVDTKINSILYKRRKTLVLHICEQQMLHSWTKWSCFTGGASRPLHKRLQGATSQARRNGDFSEERLRRVKMWSIA